jgi:DNA repair protein RadC
MGERNTLSFVCDFRKSPEEQKPREKLAQYGAKALHLWELVALIFRTGSRHKGGYFENVEILSKRVLAEAGFRGLFMQQDIVEAQNNFHLQKRHAEALVAITEIAKRLHGGYDIFDVSTPDQISIHFDSLRKSKQEQCHVLHVDAQKKCIFSELIAIGSDEFVHVRPTDILRSAIWLGAREVIVVHNHVGSSFPSEEDISWTLSLAKGAWELHTIKISDHIILGNDGYFSFAEKGLL